MSAIAVHLIVPCPDCGGAGEHSYEPYDWWHGSGVNVQLTECRTCSGHGECSMEAAEAFRSAPEPEWDGP